MHNQISMHTTSFKKSTWASAYFRIHLNEPLRESRLPLPTDQENKIYLSDKKAE